MSEPVDIHRKEVSQRVQLAQVQGGWESTHTDFKRELNSEPRDHAKLLKHILAFANTPRRTDAYIIFGVDENKQLRLFEHVGLPDGRFPAPETIYNLLRSYTKLSDVFVDSQYQLDGKLTPYVMIPLQYEGPHALSKPLKGAADVLGADEIVCRYGSSSIRATDRDTFRMKTDWDSWFLDCHYEKSARALVDVLKNRFPNHTALHDKGNYVRMIYDSAITDEFGTNTLPVLVHAYPGFDSVEPKAVDEVVKDGAYPAFGRTLIGPRFSLSAKEAAARNGVRCMPLEEIYFVNDAYAKLCRAFLRKWENERSTNHLHFIVDLDFRLSTNSANEVNHSILSFLEKQVESSGRVAILVHGEFGGGKTTTAKQLVAELCGEYLRGNTSLPKVIHVDVNNIDIRSRRDECIKSELSKYRLTHECIDSLITQVMDDEINLIFDGVDEMARPYSAAGRQEAIEILGGMGNRRAAIYLVRSSYFPHLTEMITGVGRLADHDFATSQKKIVVAQILRLRQEQVNCYLDARLGVEDARAIRSTLTQAKLESFLEDPLIISFVAELVELHGKEALGKLPRKGEQAQFLSYLVEQLLKREQVKRTRHRGLDFDQFQRILQNVAFTLVCQGLPSITPSQLEAFVNRTIEPTPITTDAVDAFRTMSWIHRSDDGTLSFRHEALTVVCAAEHICAAFERRDKIALSEWQSAAPLASVVSDCAGDLLSGLGMLGATALLGNELPFNVRTLVSDVLQAGSQRERLPIIPKDHQFGEKTLSSICRGIVTAPNLSQRSVEILFRQLGEKRRMQVLVPLLWMIARKEIKGDARMAAIILGSKIRPKFDFNDELKSVKKDPSSFLNSIFVDDLGLAASNLLDLTQYELLFRRMKADPSVGVLAGQYADRTLKSIDGEKQRRQKKFDKKFKN